MTLKEKALQAIVALHRIYSPAKDGLDRHNKIGRLISAYRAAQEKPIELVQNERFLILVLDEEPLFKQIVIGCPTCGGQSRVISIFCDPDIDLPQTRKTAKEVVCLSKAEIDQDIEVSVSCRNCRAKLEVFLNVTAAIW